MYGKRDSFSNNTRIEIFSFFLSSTSEILVGFVTIVVINISFLLDLIFGYILIFTINLFIEF